MKDALWACTVVQASKEGLSRGGERVKSHFEQPPPGTNQLSNSTRKPKQSPSDRRALGSIFYRWLRFRPVKQLLKGMYNTASRPDVKEYAWLQTLVGRRSGSGNT
jgi:hypothetical protein